MGAHRHHPMPWGGWHGAARWVARCSKFWVHGLPGQSHPGQCEKNRSDRGCGSGIPNGIRTRVAALKGRCPRPLDDRDKTQNPILAVVEHPCEISDDGLLVQHHHDCRDLGLGGVAERPCVPADHFLLRGSGLRKLCEAGGVLAACARNMGDDQIWPSAFSRPVRVGARVVPPPLRGISPRSS